MKEKRKNKKPKWSTPKLIVLLREYRQEWVLDNCKTGAMQVAGPVTGDYGCIYPWCATCDTVGSS